MGADNPSVVNDASGSNYNIGSGDSMGQAQMQYLENLQALAMKAVPKPLSNDQYMPGETQNIQQGQVSGSIIGSQPLFAASNLIPFGMMDEYKRSAYEAESEYYKNFKTYLDKPLSKLKSKLDNPWAQPEFAGKIQQITDKMLDAYANKLGGNYMQAYVALQGDKNYQRTLEGFDQYANIYNNVYKDAVDTLTKAEEPDKYYVSENQVASINKFIHSHDQLEKLSIDQLGRNAEEFASKQSVFKLAEASTQGVKEDVRSFFAANPDVNMSTDEKMAWVKTKITGDKDQAQNIINATVKANPWLSKDQAQLELYSQEVKNRVKYGVEKELQIIEKANIDRDQELRKAGVKVDDQGNAQFGNRPSALIGNVGTNAINYPMDKNKPVPTVAGMQVYVRDGNGSIKRVTLPASYNMIPTAEYDLGDEGMPVMKGRYIEGKVNFQGTEPYTPSGDKALISKGQITGTYNLGEGKSSTQVVPVEATDDAGNVVKLMGETTVLTPFESMKGQVESSIGTTDAIQYAHKKLESVTYPNGGRRNYDPMGNATKEGSKVIIPPDDADLSFFKNDANTYYNWGGKILSGKFIHENAK
jgi:small nuclear ribonucleoprotein (snRNP)-like protein